MYTKILNDPGFQSLQQSLRLAAPEMKKFWWSEIVAYILAWETRAEEEE